MNEHCDGNLFFKSLNIMQYASKSSSSLRTIMMLVPIERTERCIFVTRATARICKTANSEGGLYFITCQYF